MGFEHVVYGHTGRPGGTTGPDCAPRNEPAPGSPARRRLPKQDVRDVSAHLGLRTAYKPAMACLASRIPYGTRITEENLAQVEQAEDALKDELDLTQVRVRHHGDVARIEVPGAISRSCSPGTRATWWSGG